MRRRAPAELEDLTPFLSELGASERALDAQLVSVSLAELNDDHWVHPTKDAGKSPMTDTARDETDSKKLVVPMRQADFEACSSSADFMDVLLTQAVNSHILNRVPEEDRGKYANAAAAALVGIKPSGEVEGMLAAQLIACHNASMECYRSAMNSQIPARDYHLNQANKLCRTYTTLLEALNRHRGKGQQKVTVEHVHVHKGGQAIVGLVEGRGEGVNAKTNGSTPCS